MKKKLRIIDPAKRLLEDLSKPESKKFERMILKAAKVNMEWVSVEKKLPDYDELVIWYREDGIMFIDEIDHDSDWEYFESIHCSEFTDNNENISITHWMPLPEPPKNKS